MSFETSGEILEAMIKNGISSGFGDEWVRFGATSEHTADGSFSERTMALSQPYTGINPPYRGNVTETQEDLNAWVERVQRAGIQPNVHANGDVAIEMVLTAYERAQQVAPRPDVRPKITHCALINDDLLRRIKALDAVPAPFTASFLWGRTHEALHGIPFIKDSEIIQTVTGGSTVYHKVTPAST